MVTNATLAVTYTIHMDPTPASGYRAFSSKTAETNYRDCAAVPDWALDTPEVDSSSLV